MASLLGGGKKWLRRRNEEQYLGGLAFISRWVCGSRVQLPSDQENIILVMPSARDDMRNTYLGGSYFEPNAVW